MTGRSGRMALATSRAEAARRPVGVLTAGSVLDVVGVALLLGLAGWVAVVAHRVGGDPGPMRDLVLATVAVYVGARGLTTISPVAVPLVCVAVAVAVAVRSGPQLLDNLPGPLGYANATAAFFVLAAAAAAMLAVRVREPLVEAIAVVVALGFAVVPFLNGSLAGALLALLLLCGCLGLNRRRPTWVLAGGALLAAITVAGTVWLAGAPALGGGLSTLVDSGLTQRRTDLWRDALTMLAANPWSGVGPQRFVEFSPVARSDPDDAAWAHSEYLEVAAETGWPGLVLIAAVVLWGFARLAVGPTNAATAFAGAGLAAVTVHAGIDYVLHFPLVALTAAALVGAGPVLPTHDRRPHG